MIKIDLTDEVLQEFAESFEYDGSDLNNFVTKTLYEIIQRRITQDRSLKAQEIAKNSVEGVAEIKTKIDEI